MADPAHAPLPEELLADPDRLRTSGESIDRDRTGTLAAGHGHRPRAPPTSASSTPRGWRSRSSSPTTTAPAPPSAPGGAGSCFRTGGRVQSHAGPSQRAAPWTRDHSTPSPPRCGPTGTGPLGHRDHEEERCNHSSWPRWRQGSILAGQDLEIAQAAPRWTMEDIRPLLDAEVCNSSRGWAPAISRGCWPRSATRSS